MKLPARPKLRHDLIFRQVDDDFVVYDPITDRTALFNLTAAVVLDLCDGRRTVDEIAGEVTEIFKADASEVAENVTASLEEFMEHEFIEG